MDIFLIIVLSAFLGWTFYKSFMKQKVRMAKEQAVVAKEKKQLELYECLLKKLEEYDNGTK